VHSLLLDYLHNFGMFSIDSWNSVPKICAEIRCFVSEFIFRDSKCAAIFLKQNPMGSWKIGRKGIWKEDVVPSWTAVPFLLPFPMFFSIFFGFLTIGWRNIPIHIFCLPFSKLHITPSFAKLRNILWFLP
jgi:hypothetical protein